MSHVDSLKQILIDKQAKEKVCIEFRSHLAGRSNIPLQIGPDIKGLIPHSLGSSGLEKPKTKKFRRWKAKISQFQNLAIFLLLT